MNWDCDVIRSGRSRCKWTADGYRRRTDGESPIRCYTRKYLRSKNTGTGKRTTKGVDADVSSAVTEENLEEGIAFAKAFAEKAGVLLRLQVQLIW